MIPVSDPGWRAKIRFDDADHVCRVIGWVMENHDEHFVTDDAVVIPVVVYPSGVPAPAEHCECWHVDDRTEVDPW